MTDDSKIESTWLDRSPGSGSLTWAEAKRDEEATHLSHDGRAETRTTFYQEGHFSDPTDHSNWEELASLNDDMRHPDRGTQNHYLDREQAVDIICGTLDCSEYQRRRVKWTIEDLGNLREFSPTTKKESIILAATSLVVDEDTTEFENRVAARDPFHQFLDDLDMSFSDLWDLREKIRETSSAFE